MSGPGISRRSERAWLESVASNIIQRLSIKAPARNLKLERQPQALSKGSLTTAVLGYVKSLPDCEIELILSDDGGTLPQLLYRFASDTQRSAKLLAVSADLTFEEHQVADYELAQGHPFDVPVLDLGYNRSESFFGVKPSYAFTVDRPVPFAFVVDIASFFQEIARNLLAAGKNIRKRTNQPRDGRFIRRPAISRFGCVRCGKRLFSYDRECQSCGWREGEIDRATPGSPYDVELADT